MTLWSHGLARSRYKVKALYFHYQSYYSHQSWQNGNLSWRFPNYKVVNMNLWWHSLVRLRDKLKSLYHHYHSPYGNQTWQVAHLLWGILVHLVTWPFSHLAWITWQTKTIISLLSQYLQTPNVAGCWLTLSGSCPYSHMIFKSHGLDRWRDKLKILHPYSITTYGDQSW